MPKARLVFDGDWVYTEKEIRIHKLTQETENKINNIPGVVDDVNSDSTTDALSAHMGKVLQDQINNLSGTNTYLSNWDCTAGLPETEPQVDPYRYKAWNYYIVSVVAWSWWTNYRPHWNQYIQWVASTTVETWNISINDWYIYDGSQWLIQPAWNREIVIDDSLSSTSRNAVENRAVYNALTQKQNNILDLNTIREGAAAWATALQPLDNITELTNNAWYQTAWDVAAAIETLAPHWVWEWILTLQKNSTTIDTFSANATQNKTINITVPTTVAELTDANDYATKDYVDWSVIHTWSTPPANPEEWMLWYDTTNDVLKVYDWTQRNLTWKVYSAWTGINISNADEISNTWVLSINGDTWVITWVATESYVDSAVDSSIHSWSTAPTNPEVWQLWYDTINNVLKVWNWTSWIVIQELLVNWVNIKTINNESLLGSWNITISNWLPSWWTVWQVVTKTANWAAWADSQWITISGSSFGSFVNACKANWTKHTKTYNTPSDSRMDETYIYKWLWRFDVPNIHWASWTAAVYVNWETIFTEHTWSWGYSVKDFRHITMSPWDIVRFYTSSYGTSSSIYGAQVYDYYDETAPITKAWIYHNEEQALISYSTDWVNWATMSDRNLWASHANVYDAGSYWYYYQFGDNYPFRGDVTYSTTNTQIDWSAYGPWNYYYSWGLYYCNSSDTASMWDNSGNPNLRWWHSWLYTDMQWPCSAWWHIPGVTEIDKIRDMMEAHWLNTTDWLRKYLLIPLAWVLSYDNWSRVDTWTVWIIASTFRFSGGWRFYTYWRAYSSTDGAYIVDGLAFDWRCAVPIRPFKDVPVQPTNWWDILYQF